ncbi:MAG TPA: diguanylate cyclase [Cyanobacteria bacterium UBA8803]|nr:diguanylate cyclase [Cyanobacteria bacterium UBA9273]HBL62198.1 diguanylate cyclase [Cyanobacteria bacterium UBA8803]
MPNAQFPNSHFPFLEYPSGPLPLDSSFYIPRPPIEELAYQELTQPGSVIRIKATKEMGKTSLMLRILAHATTLGYRTVNLDFQQVDAAILSNLDKFLRWFCTRISQELNLKPNLDEYWDEDIGSKVSCTIYLRWYLLEQLDTPVVLALNEVHRIFEYPSLAQEFLPLLRSWHEEAQQVEAWQKLRLIVVYSTEVYVPLNITQSPFNVGLPLRLPEFTREQVEELARCYGLDWADGSQAEQLMAMVGGHPGLVRLAIYHLAHPTLLKEEKWGRLQELLQDADTESGIYRDHLRGHWTTLKKNPALAAAFKTVVTANESVILEPIFAYELESMGLVKLSNDKVAVSCELYRRYFGKQFQQRENLGNQPEQRLQERLMQLEEENLQLQRLCILDELTQLANRRYFDQFLEQEWRQLASEAAPMSLILCEIDFFKIYNDSFGHQAGDNCLRQVASAIYVCVQQIIKGGLIARYSGDEFAVILPHTEAVSAVQIAEKIRNQVKALGIAHAKLHIGLPETISLSLGVASIIPHADSSSMVLLVGADNALYQSKAQGHDRVTLYDFANH